MPVIPGDMGIKSFSYEILIDEDGEEVCENCLKGWDIDPESETLTPIFASTEMDRNPTCSECGYVSFIFSPTNECMNEWVRQISDYLVTGKGSRDYLDRVSEQSFWLFGWEKNDEMIFRLYERRREIEKDEEE